MSRPTVRPVQVAQPHSRSRSIDSEPGRVTTLVDWIFLDSPSPQPASDRHLEHAVRETSLDLVCLEAGDSGIRERSCRNSSPSGIVILLTSLSACSLRGSRIRAST